MSGKKTKHTGEAPWDKAFDAMEWEYDHLGGRNTATKTRYVLQDNGYYQKVVTKHYY